MIPCLSATPLPDTPATEVAAHIERWAERGWLRPLDAAFAGFLWREAPDAPGLLLLAAALASHQLGRGHACLDLAATLADPDFALSLPPDGVQDATDTPRTLLAGVDAAAWRAALDHPQLVGSGEGDTPLVLTGDRLYLRRYWRFEQAVIAAVSVRVAAPAAASAAEVRRVLDTLFEASDNTDWQKLACALAARSAFSVITGGPGTGETATVVRLLALLQSLALQADPARPLRIRLAAPTGKAAARLNASIGGALEKLDIDEAVRAAIPASVTTLHRLLGARPDSRAFRHDADHPLALDVLVVDEASMVDLEMMAAVLAVLAALPAQARLVLLGDRDQLASVEAGAVLGVLAARAREGHYTAETAAWLAEASGQTIAAEYIDPVGTPLDQSIAMLRISRRFDAASGIGRLAEAVNAGVPAKVRTELAAAHGDVASHTGADALAALRTAVLDGTRAWLELAREPVPADDHAADETARRILDTHAAFQVLCAVRKGEWGVEGLNRVIARWLTAAGRVDTGHDWYAGRPVLVTHNDYGLGLMNGDIGVTLARREADGSSRLRVAFVAADTGRVRWVLPSRLRAVETVFAMTVHKSQGSEFGTVALVLPDTVSPVLTRELLYTGITRAREHLALFNPGGERVLEAAVTRRVLRASGLDALHGGEA
jgi:exodeoxyribonuclease V alpha subunit